MTTIPFRDAIGEDIIGPRETLITAPEIREAHKPDLEAQLAEAIEPALYQPDTEESVEDASPGPSLDEAERMIDEAVQKLRELAQEGP